MSERFPGRRLFDVPSCGCREDIECPSDIVSESGEVDLDSCLGETAPSHAAQASFQRQINQDEAKFTEDAEIVTIQASIPLYQAGSEYAQIRATRHAVDAARHDLPDRQQELPGARITIEVLQQQQLLFQQQKILIQNIANTVQDSYALAAATGRLTARDLKLDTPIYDPTIHLKKVKWEMIGME
jgi:outer membrane protein